MEKELKKETTDISKIIKKRNSLRGIFDLIGEIYGVQELRMAMELYFSETKTKEN